MLPVLWGGLQRDGVHGEGCSVTCVVVRAECYPCCCEGGVLPVLW